MLNVFQTFGLTLEDMDAENSMDRLRGALAEQEHKFGVQLEQTHRMVFDRLREALNRSYRKTEKKEKVKWVREGF